ncbi:low temperature requirement protein A [uncultured Microbacterium sp.]|uniref:low temperature requirement protein A n=1 Tax=uncultured Microbacterium sp. TaxID=191216 RepID=UPI0028D613EC|nr:low temperature requirement protein A [uncultured Microbacterium sp.]
MAFGMARNVLRPADSARADRVTYVELFFDLVFVLALTQLSAYISENHTPLGALEGAVMVCALWWSWVSTTWVTNWLDPMKLPVRGAVIVLAFVALVMSVSIAEAFGDRAWAFAIAYVILQVGRTGFIVWATIRHDRAVARDFALVLGWTVASSALWIVGALLPLTWQLPLWAAALAVELAGTILGFPVPGRGKVMLQSWDLSGPHIAERTTLFVLIALGEGLLVTGFAFVEKESSTSSIAAMVTAFVAAAATWWIYFDHGERVGTEAIEASDEPGRLARTAYTWVHLLIIAGIVLMSVGDKQMLTLPDQRGLSTTVVIVGAPVLFLSGTVAFRRVLEGRWSRPQLLGLLALAVLTGAASVVPVFDALSLSIACAMLLVGVAAGETVERVRRGRRAGG